MSDSPKRTLVVGAELTLETDDARIDIHTSDGTLYVDCDTVEALLAAYRLRESLSQTSARWISAGETTLADSQLAVSVPVVVRIDGVRVGRYTPRGSVGLLGRLLGGLPVRSSPLGALRIALRRLRSSFTARQ